MSKLCYDCAKIVERCSECDLDKILDEHEHIGHLIGQLHGKQNSCSKSMQSNLQSDKARLQDALHSILFLAMGDFEDNALRALNTLGDIRSCAADAIGLCPSCGESVKYGHNEDGSCIHE